MSTGTNLSGLEVLMGPKMAKILRLRCVNAPFAVHCHENQCYP